MTGMLARRAFLVSATTAAATLSLAAKPRAAAMEPLRVGGLTPNTGAGGPFGPEIAAAHRLVVARVNAAGGVLGLPVELTAENSATSPEIAIPAARKLIDVDRVIAILGGWSSAVTLGIMPLCQEANVIQMCASTSLDIAPRDEKGLVFNFQALSPLWGKALARLALRRGLRSFAAMALDVEFTEAMRDAFIDEIKAGGGKALGVPLRYGAGLSSYRAEVERLIQPRPEAVFLASFVSDFATVYGDIRRAGYDGRVITASIAVGTGLRTAHGGAADGILHGLPTPPIDSPAYKAYLELAGLEDTGAVQHPFGTAGWDQMSVLLLAVESAGTTDPVQVAQHIRRIANPPGETVTDVLEGLGLIRDGRQIDYSGAGSQVDFGDDSGTLRSREFTLWEIADGVDRVVDRLRD